MWAEAILAATRASHNTFYEPYQVVPLLDMRSFGILEDRRSSWWKGPRPLSHCLEVSTEKLPGQELTLDSVNKHLRFVTALSVIP